MISSPHSPGENLRVQSHIMPRQGAKLRMYAFLSMSLMATNASSCLEDETFSPLTGYIGVGYRHISLWCVYFLCSNHKQAIYLFFLFITCYLKTAVCVYTCGVHLHGISETLNLLRLTSYKLASCLKPFSPLTGYRQGADLGKL